VSALEQRPGSNAETEADLGGAYLYLQLGDTIRGIDHSLVQEVRYRERVTRLPNQPDHVQGLLNLRGALLPIFDLRRWLGLSSVEYGPEAVIIILKLMHGERNRMVGVLADAVVELPVDTDAQSVELIDINRLLDSAVSQWRDS
jgi:purine-binding chemotaxis protein CheW